MILGLACRPGVTVLAETLTAPIAMMVGKTRMLLGLASAIADGRCCLGDGGANPSTVLTSQQSHSD